TTAGTTRPSGGRRARTPRRAGSGASGRTSAPADLTWSASAAERRVLPGASVGRCRVRRPEVWAGREVSAAPAEAVDVAALALRRAAGPAVAHGDPHGELLGRRGRALVDHRLRRERRRDPLHEHLLDDEDPLDETAAHDDAVTHPHVRRRFGALAVDPHV